MGTPCRLHTVGIGQGGWEGLIQLKDDINMIIQNLLYLVRPILNES